MSRPLPYPDLYTEKDRSRLPPEQQMALYQLGEAIREGRLGTDQIEAFRTALGQLPANAVPDAAGTISKIAKLNWRFDWAMCPEKYDRSALDELKRDMPDGLLSCSSPFLTKEVRLMQRHPALCWLFAYHDSGYVRQAAMNLINTPPSSAFDYATLVYRMNDWVSSVRDAALGAGKKLLPQASSEVVADSALFLLDYSRQLNRWNGEAKALVEQPMRQPDILAAIVKQICDCSDGSGARGLKLLMREPYLDSHFPTLATEAKQPHIRALAMQALLTGEIAWTEGVKPDLIEDYRGRFIRERNLITRPLSVTVDQVFWLQAAASDKSANLRKLAADALIARREAANPEMDILAMALASDKKPAVAEWAKFYLGKRTSAAAIN